MATLTVVKKLSMAAAGAAFIALGTVGNPAMAEVITFQGADPVQGSTGGRPNSDAAAANFDTAAGGLGAINLIDFENTPLGNFSSLIVAPGVIVTLTNTSSNVSPGITNDPVLAVLVSIQRRAESNSCGLFQLSASRQQLLTSPLPTRSKPSERTSQTLRQVFLAV